MNKLTVNATDFYISPDGADSREWVRWATAVTDALSATGDLTIDDLIADTVSTTGNISITSADEKALLIQRTGDFGDTDPLYSIGRIVEGGNNSKMRFIMSATGVTEHAILEGEGAGTWAAIGNVIDGRGSRFETFECEGPFHATGRINTYPDFGLEMGPGGQKVSTWSRATNVVTMTTVGNHCFGSGATMTLINTDGDLAAGTFTITVTGATTFTFTEAGADRSVAAPGTALYVSCDTDAYIRRNGYHSLDIGFGSDSKLVMYDDTLTLQSGVSLNIGGAILGSVGSGITASVTGRLTQGWNKFTVPYTVFTTAGLSQSKTIAVLPAKGRIEEAILTIETNFALAASILSLAIGLDTDVDALIEEHLPATASSPRGLADADLGVKLIRATAIQGGARHSMSATANITATMVSDSANLGAAGVTSLTTGSATLYLLVDVAP